MPLKGKLKVGIKNRHVGEVPFYKLRHSFDELPLDPVKPFIIEKIQKLRTSRSAEFATDLNLHSYDVNEMCTSTLAVTSKNSSDLRQTPSATATSLNTSLDTKNDDYDWKWLKDENSCINSFGERMMEATQQIKKMCAEQRLKNFKRNAQILTVLKNGKRKKKSFEAKKSGSKSYMRFCVPYKPGDEFKHRTPEERQRELKRIGNMIDDIIASKWSRKIEQPETNNSLSKSSNEEHVKPRKKHKSLTNEEFLISLKMKEKR